MSLPAPLGDVIPEQTIQVARAAFPKGHPYMRMRDALGPIYTNLQFAPLFSHTGRPAEAARPRVTRTLRRFRRQHAAQRVDCTAKPSITLIRRRLSDTVRRVRRPDCG